MRAPTVRSGLYQAGEVKDVDVGLAQWGSRPVAARTRSRSEAVAGTGTAASNGAEGAPSGLWPAHSTVLCAAPGSS